MPLDVQGVSGTDYTFAGPYSNPSKLEDRSGVYVIVCVDGNDVKTGIDAGQSAEVKTRVENHDRVPCWKRECHGTLKVAVFYTPNKQEAGRKEIEQDIRDNFELPCGGQ